MSGGWNPRFAAWVEWLGFGLVDDAKAKLAFRLHGTWGFTAWIARRLSEAARLGEGAHFRGADWPAIDDHGRFTAYCARFARENAA